MKSRLNRLSQMFGHFLRYPFLLAAVLFILIQNKQWEVE